MDSESNSSSNNPSRKAAAATTAAMLTPKPTQLVACFMHLQGYHIVSYSFQDVLDHKTLTLLFKPTRSIPWPDQDNNNFTNHMWVSFLHSHDVDGDDGDGLGFLYAVGGVDSYPFSAFQQIPETLPNVFTRISLGEGYRMLDAYTTHMNAGKFIPLVAEIDHLIYVLSGPTNLFRPSYKVSYNTFEVYNPRDMSWKLLSDLPFITDDHYKTINFFGYKYSHLVLGQKLFVSDTVLASVYDIASNTWSASHLFSDCHIPPNYKPLSNECGPGFPFIGEALV